MRGYYQLGKMWVLSIGRLRELSELYQQYIQGKDINLNTNNLNWYPGKNTMYQFIEDTAIINIDGTLVKHLDPFFLSVGCVSTIDISEHLINAMKNTHIKNIILNFNSLGGVADGIQALAEFIYECSMLKKIIAISENNLKSGAYWLASATNEILIGSTTCEVGSIGVCGLISYKPKIEQTQTEFTAGEFKNAKSPNAEMTEEIRAYLQSQIEHTYDLFISDIARFRKVSKDKVLNDMADGKTFIGQQAIDVGLVDGFYHQTDWHLNKKISAIK